jgi:Dynamin family
MFQNRPLFRPFPSRSHSQIEFPVPTPLFHQLIALLYTPLLSLCVYLHTMIQIRGPLAPQSDQGTALPLVLLVGNHSSGKSSFINYVVGRTVQTAGVAPTDDCFTILAPGRVDRDQDGPAVIGDPHLGFAALQQFGPTLVHHTVLKIRKDLNTNFMMGTLFTIVCYDCLCTWFDTSDK